MEGEALPREPGPVRINFELARTLSQAEVESLLRHICSAPTAPGDSEVDPAGHGWVLYIGDDILTADELSDVVEWLREFPEMVRVLSEPVAAL